jgi:hypothetical protein
MWLDPSTAKRIFPNPLEFISGKRGSDDSDG